ncbi:MAG: phospho-sugar mutase, partial [Erysipelotrichaceae bacterium]|nr:phospho-sugar mutase [Erysipelotrichaceae bacterium]
KTINVLTGFKYIGEQILKLEQQGKKENYIFGFEESYGYLAGTHARDKDAVVASFLICEMFAFYKTRGISLLDKLNEIFDKFGFCMNVTYSNEFEGSSGFKKMQDIMVKFRKGAEEFGGKKVIELQDYLPGINGLPSADVLKFILEGNCSVVVRPSGTEPKLKFYISVSAKDEAAAHEAEQKILADLNKYLD